MNLCQINKIYEPKRSIDNIKIVKYLIRIIIYNRKQDTFTNQYEDVEEVHILSSQWIISNSILYICKEDKTFYLPKAIDVYAYLVGNLDYISDGCPIDCCNPQEKFPEINFCRIGSSMKLRTHFDEKEHKIQLSIFVLKAQKEYQIPWIDNSLPEHIVANNQWIYLSDNYNEIIAVLSMSGISGVNNLTLSNYLVLVKSLQNNSNIEIEDDVVQLISNMPLENSIGIPSTINAILYPYQKCGFLWLKYITGEGCGCILGDEMGLGKTLQIITLIVSRREQGQGVSLVVAPVSLMENWRREFVRFAPTMKILVHHGSQRTGNYKMFSHYDVVVSSYSNAVSDLAIFRMLDWDLVVLDEAQNIKNPEASRTKSVKRIPRAAGIAVTGTPFENHVTDVWSLTDFVFPDFLGTLTNFNQIITDDVNGAAAIEPMITPLLLRRRVAEVAKDLPEKIDIPVPLIMDDAEAHHYENVRQMLKMSSKSNAMNLAILQKLRMFCAHPYLIDGYTNADPQIVSTKYTRLCELLEEIVSTDEKVILFTSFNGMFEILRNDIPSRFGIRVFEINGSTPVEKRQDIIDHFSNERKSSLLILNPRAAGTGLNITAANHVIHFNLEWNPAVQDQASARAFRRGQTKTVFIYRLFYSNTVEEIVNERIERKREMAQTAIVGTTGDEENRDDIVAALMISPLGR